jgi:ATP-dependent protease HslVU (ClpYQ) peptidase subunit
MTVLAWDGKTLASDSRLSSQNDILSDNVTKLFNVDIDYLQHICSDRFLNQDITHELYGIAVGKKLVYHITGSTDYLIRYPRDTKLVDGSGGTFARAALELGKNAKAAVKLSIKLNSSCGGRIQTINCEV